MPFRSCNIEKKLDEDEFLFVLLKYYYRIKIKIRNIGLDLLFGLY